MNLTKENKWGIILGAVWGLVSLGISLYSGTLWYQGGLELQRVLIWILLLPGTISVYYLMASENILSIVIAPLTGIAIGYFITILVKAIK